MREIKFRVWCSANNRWVKDVCSLRSSGVLLRKMSGRWLPVNMENHHIQLFTGLTDSKGTEIYEGDIVRIRPLEYGYDWHIHRVAYCSHMGYPAFDLFPRLDCEANGLSCAMATCEIEVIGNIFENPELMCSE